MQTYIKGQFRRSIYENTNGYYIGIFKVTETNNEALADYVNHTITFTGYFHELNDIDTYIFYGELVNHDKYGEQFKVDSYERVIPQEKDSIVEFLTSGLFKGIGEKKAKRIVDVLGENTLKIILENPDNLILIPTVTKNNIDTLHNKLKEYEASYEIVLYLGSIGFSTKDAMTIYNHYKNKTKDIINDDIYKLVLDILSINFKKVDTVALNMGIEKDSLIRVRGSILYIMDEISTLFGHCYYKEEEIYNILPKVLGINISKDKFKEAIDSLIIDLEIVYKDDKYYLKKMLDSEELIVKRFRRLNKTEDILNKKIDTKIKELEHDYDIKYNDDQYLAIKNSYLKSFLIITGGPGTGKTTILKAMIELYRRLNKLSYEELNEKVALLAPTGRAAKRMSEVTLFKASTIHRFLKWQKETDRFQVNEYNKSKVEFVIIDEASMIDTYLMASLLKGLSAYCKIILVGDVNQLPSVGPGQVLYDLISSEKLNVVKLNRLYRQGKESNIINLAYDIRNSQINREIFNKNKDLTFIECSNDKVVDHVCEIASKYKKTSYKDFQILVPMYKGLAGIDNINDKIQAIFNKKALHKKEIKLVSNIYRENDKVIQLINMPDENVYNGDIGIIEKIVTSPKKEIYINFDGNIVKYTASNFSNFRLAYAISIHKSQGTETDTVIIPIIRNYNKMLYQKLIYTAVTRCKKKLYLIGEISALELASKRVNEDLRRTTIKELLINGIK